MRIAYSNIQFELTRRCNQSCLHCCRGKSQNLDLTQEVIDAFFDMNEIHSINTLRFSGGEPTLNGEALEYLVERLSKKNIETNTFILSINGLNYNESFVKGLNKLSDHCSKFARIPRKNYGILFVSQSQFHQKAVVEVIKKFSELSYFIVPSEIQTIDTECLLPYGNAAENKLTTNQPNIDEVIDYDKSIEIVEREGETFLEFNKQYISSNGNILVDGCISYDMMDIYQIGNVKEKSMVDIYSNQPKMLQLRKK